MRPSCSPTGPCPRPPIFPRPSSLVPRRPRRLPCLVARRLHLPTSSNSGGTALQSPNPEPSLPRRFDRRGYPISQAPESVGMARICRKACPGREGPGHSPCTASGSAAGTHREPDSEMSYSPHLGRPGANRLIVPNNSLFLSLSLSLRGSPRGGRRAPGYVTDCLPTCPKMT